MKKIKSLFLVSVMMLGFFAVGTPAQAITCDSATLTGFIETGGKTIRARFRYAVTQNAVAAEQGTTTIPQTFTHNDFIEQFIPGLESNTTYYYRLEITDFSGNVDFGDILHFSTPSCNTNPTPQNPNVDIKANGSNGPVTLSPGQTLNLSWTSSNATFCSLGSPVNSGVNTNDDASYGSGHPFYPSTSGTNYTITCTNSSGASDSDTVKVTATNQAPQTCQDPSATNYGGSLPCKYPTPVSVDLKANGSNGPVTLSPGQELSLTWSSSGALSCNLSAWGGVPNNGLIIFNTSHSQYPSTSGTNYTITCTNGSQSDSDTVKVTATNQAPQTCQDQNAINYGGSLPCKYPTPQQPTVNLTASPSSINSGQSSTLSWNSTNAVSCTASNGWSGTKATNGSQTVSPTSTTTYKITCVNSAGDSAFDTAQVTVNNIQTCQDQNAINYGGSLPCKYPDQTCKDPSATNYGGSLPCKYPPQTCQDQNATNYGGSLPCKYPDQTCKDPNATNYGGTLPCKYPQAVSVDITADKTILDFNDGTIVRWSTNNATSCEGQGGTSSWRNANLQTGGGSFFTGPLTSDLTFTIFCKNSTSSNSDSITLQVRAQGNKDISVDISANDTSIDEGDDVRIEWDSNNADECDTTGGNSDWSRRTIGTSGSFTTELSETETFGITCRNDDGGSDSDSVRVEVDEDDNDNDNDDDEPRVTIDADDDSIQSGQSTRVRWDVDDADSCEGDNGANGWNGRDLDEDGGSFSTGALFSDTTFTITCENDEGDDTASVRIEVGGSTNTNNNISAPTAVTLAATQVTTGSAQLNGLIFNSGNSSSNAWFEWGTTASLGNSTRNLSVGSSPSTTHSDIITGLTPGVRYFYRVVAENSSGRSNGSTLSLLTTVPQTGGPNNTVVRNTTTTVINQVGSKSLVMLTIDGGDETITPGEHKSYHVEWKNISNQTLRRTVLRVIFPAAMSFDGASDGTYTRQDNVLTFNIGTLSPGEDGELFLGARGNTVLQEGELVVVVANMVYTDESEVQGDAVAYATHHALINGGSVLGASVFGAGFLPAGLFGWLFLIILLLILLLLARYLFGQMNNPRNVTINTLPPPPAH